MGKAAVELPDPLNNPPTGAKEAVAPAASADDLLAQLAGEEIDRLLSEAGSRADVDSAPLLVQVPPDMGHSTGEDDQAPPPTQTPAEAAPTEPAANAGLSQQLDELFDQLVEADQAEEDSPAQKTEQPLSLETPPAAAAATQEVAAAPSVPKHAEKAVQPDLPALPPTAIPQPVVQALEPEAETSLIERTALNAVEPSVAATLQEDAEDEDERLPFWMLPLAWLAKVLQWLNAPLEACPDRLRDMIGKIALLTLLNATGILIYVLFFRKIPHP